MAATTRTNSTSRARTPRIGVKDQPESMIPDPKVSKGAQSVHERSARILLARGHRAPSVIPTRPTANRNGRPSKHRPLGATHRAARATPGHLRPDPLGSVLRTAGAARHSTCAIGADELVEAVQARRRADQEWQPRGYSERRRRTRGAESRQWTVSRRETNVATSPQHSVHEAPLGLPDRGKAKTVRQVSESSGGQGRTRVRERRRLRYPKACSSRRSLCGRSGPVLAVGA